MSTVKTTYNMDRDTHKAIKIFCANKDMTMTEFLRLACILIPKVKSEQIAEHLAQIRNTSGQVHT